MRRDYIVTPRSNAEVRRIAKLARKNFQINNKADFDICNCLMSEYVETVAGKKLLKVNICEDREMGIDDAVTHVYGDRVVIDIRKSIWALLHLEPRLAIANSAYYRARWTMAHELGHAVLNHDRGPMARATGANAAIKSHPVIRPFESAERQADQFAAAFLVELDVAKTCQSPEEISAKFSISVTAAKALFDEFHKGEKSQVIVEGFAELMRSLGRPLSKNTDASACPVCGEPVMTSAGGNKSSCETCRRTGDRLEEGDEFYW